MEYKEKLDKLKEKIKDLEDTMKNLRFYFDELMSKKKMESKVEDFIHKAEKEVEALEVPERPEKENPEIEQEPANAVDDDETKEYTTFDAETKKPRHDYHKNGGIWSGPKVE